MNKNTRIVIPMRRNSKGLPFKNRKLIEKTLDTIPSYMKTKVTIATDDEFMFQICKGYDFFFRSQDSARDDSPTKEVMKEVCQSIEEDMVIMLYVTYPDRSWQDIEKAFNFFKKANAKSMLCRKELEVSPYLMMYSDGIKGRQVIPHDLYRRQDYPECFEISHYICIFKRNEIDLLNNNMYNSETVYYPIDCVVDVDYEEDLERFYEKNKCNS